MPSLAVFCLLIKLCYLCYTKSSKNEYSQNNKSSIGVPARDGFYHFNRWWPRYWFFYMEKYTIEELKRQHFYMLNIEDSKREAREYYKKQGIIKKEKAKKKKHEQIEKEKTRLKRERKRKEVREKILEQQQKQLKYIENRKKYLREYYKERRKNDPIFKLNINLSSSISQSLKGEKNGKHWEDLVGYILVDLKKHIEAQFKDGMSWDNYGRNGWHLDHKIPKSLFNIKGIKSKGFKKCWALENLQPMWETENNFKGNKLLY